MPKNKRPLFIIFIGFFQVFVYSITLNAQFSINTDSSNPDSTAILDIKSTTKGMLIPRMTEAQIGSIMSPADGLQVFNTDDEKLYIFVANDNFWKEVQYGSGEISPPAVCGDPIDYEGQTYNTVLIGTQCWMAENLNVGTMIDSDNEQTNNSTIEKYCYDDNAANCDTYGGWYMWKEMMQYVYGTGVQGICPEGWHIPSDDEWCTLENFVDAGAISCSTTGYRGSDAGGNLKETGWAYFNVPNTGATNSSGFTGYGGGRVANGTSYRMGFEGYYWTALDDYGNSYARVLSHDKATIERGAYSRDYGFSVRCIKN